MKLLLVTPPLTQLNTPYPATAFLKGYLESRGHAVRQADLGIVTVDRLMTRAGLARTFDEAQVGRTPESPPQVTVFLGRRHRYLDTIDAVMRFLRGAEPTLATRIVATGWLPRGPRFDRLADLDWAFGVLGTADRARHLATLYLEDLTDFIQATVSPGFALVRYAEHLAVAAPTFDALADALAAPPDVVERTMLGALEEEVESFAPEVVGLSVPFPGNLLGALRCGQWLKRHRPAIRVALGGGYVSTELRQLGEPRVFDLCDHVLLDEGEPGLARLLEHLDGQRGEGELIRTLVRREGAVTLVGGEARGHVPLGELPAPDYSDLPLDRYISLVSLANPMHRLWSDGRWNKLVLARGCYWARCAFCDTALDYIAGYDPAPAARVVDWMESVMAQTGQSGFHFVDEAAPPKSLRHLAEEILRRRLAVTWWANVRFERAFTPDLCALLSESGCIALSGGLEVVAPRVLALLDKGVTVEQAVRATAAMTDHDIMVHAYLMYGFPTQTAQETVDALEIVRQMFEEGLLHSAFWHRFAMTVHSPAGRRPERFGARRSDEGPNPLANNEVPFDDGQGLDLDMLGDGLRAATYNYLHGAGVERPAASWFAAKVPRPTVKPGFVAAAAGRPVARRPKRR